MELAVCDISQVKLQRRQLAFWIWNLEESVGEKHRQRVINVQMASEATEQRPFAVQEEWSERFKENQASVGSREPPRHVGGKTCLEE